MKTVVTSDMVAHLWANKSQKHAKNGGGCFYFEDETIFSFGAHFPIARHTECRALLSDNSGPEKPTRKVPCVLFTTDSRGPRTSKHMSDTRRAIAHGVKIFHVPCLMVHGESETRHKENFQDFIKRAIALVKSAEKARSRKEGLLASARALVTDANEYAMSFGLRDRCNAEDVKGLADKALKAEKRETAKQERARKTREAEYQRVKAQAVALFPAFLKEWQAGNGYAESFARVQPSADSKLENMLVEMLRAVPYFRLDGRAVVESSMGAKVPARAAYRLFNELKALRAMPGEIPLGAGADDTEQVEAKRNVMAKFEGVEVGSFRIRHVYADGSFVAGCHDVKWAQVEDLARLAGWNLSPGVYMAAPDAAPGWNEVPGETDAPLPVAPVIENPAP